MSLRIITQQEDDGRWIADVPSLRGVMTYGDTRDEAIQRAKELTLCVVEDRVERGESLPAHSGNRSFEVWESTFEFVTPERFFNGLLRAGWVVKRENERFKILSKQDNPDFVFAFDEDEKIRVRMFDWLIKAGATLKDY